ncbi:hypothetical protein L873DRAFT_1811871 [Choiromyces venosus 120613-1]|uniref:Uncharacterized protein n=1 Tax=Choiromyces venosus 120613-1 TaxID=1336337 RepID=A0A3N4JQA8_9PEZI|nr:hypothetical protein L873DRAFT_1811871 [Choiromyces venosus 120613-1]
MPFHKIKEITGVAALTANNICDESDNHPLSLQELIASSALDADPHPRCPRLLDTEDKDKLIEFVKKNFQTQRMTINDLCREPGYARNSKLF